MMNIIKSYGSYFILTLDTSLSLSFPVAVISDIPNMYVY